MSLLVLLGECWLTYFRKKKIDKKLFIKGRKHNGMKNAISKNKTFKMRCCL